MRCLRRIMNSKNNIVSLCKRACPVLDTGESERDLGREKEK
jgi:hypothetical protein